MRIYWTCTSSYFLRHSLKRLIGFQLPYWNELADAGKFATSPVLLDFGGNGSEEDDWAVIYGPFANLTRYLGYGTTNTKHLLTRQVNDTRSLEAGQTYTDTLLAQETFSGFKTALAIFTAESGVHIAGHLGVGGDVRVLPSTMMIFYLTIFVRWLTLYRRLTIQCSLCTTDI